MMKNILFIIFTVLLTLAVVGESNDVLDVEESSLYDDEFNSIAEEDIYEGVQDNGLTGSAGITPDSALYFIETIMENILVGDNPETALKYKEEKVLELKKMVESGDEGAARKALERLKKYNLIIKREVSPQNEQEVRASSKAVKVVLGNIEKSLEGKNWELEDLEENLKEEDRIALAAKISKKIDGLCRALSNLDPLEYAQVCKTGDDAPKWKKDLDRELTADQAKEAREFFGIMSECFKNPTQCRCEDISIKPFAEKCSIIAPLVAECDAGNEEACDKMDQVGDPIDLLPDYLQDVLDEVEDQYGESRHDLHIPMECEDAGATSREDCMKIMFKLRAPPECVEAAARGEFDISQEGKARKACEEIMFNLEAPEECREAGIKDHKACERMMFKLDAPEECLAAGLTGNGRNDWDQCQKIRFRLDAPQECLDAGIDGSGRNDWKKCESIRFKLDSPQECLDAGLTGDGPDDWRKCGKITFLLDAPEECHQFADARDPWRACQPVQFKLDADPDCVAAGLDGTGRNDWDKCNAITFKRDAPKECVDAGIDGSRANAWRKCDKIRQELEGVSWDDCKSNQMHICDDRGYNCKCVEGDQYDCAVMDCQEGYYCDAYQGCVQDHYEGEEKYERDDAYDDNDDEDFKNVCQDCASTCADRPGERLSGTACVDGNRCECYYESDSSGQVDCGFNEYLICEGDECKCVPNDPPTGEATSPESHPEDDAEQEAEPEQELEREQAIEPEQEPEPEPEPKSDSELEGDPEPSVQEITGSAVDLFNVYEGSPFRALLGALANLFN